MYVREVISNGPAEKAGIRPGDVIVELYGRTLSAQNEHTFEFIAGDTIKAVVFRNGQENDVRVTVTPASEDSVVTNFGAEGHSVLSRRLNRELYGAISVHLAGGLLDVANLTEELRRGYKIGDSVDGALVTDKYRRGGVLIMPGDVIVAVDQEKVRGAADVARLVEGARSAEKKSVALIVIELRNGKQTTEAPEL